MKRKPVYCTKCGILCSHSKHSDGSRTWYCPNNHGQMKREEPVEGPDAEIERLKVRIEAFISRAATEEDRADSSMRLECAQLREKVAQLEKLGERLASALFFMDHTCAFYGPAYSAREKAGDALKEWQERSSNAGKGCTDGRSAEGVG